MDEVNDALDRIDLDTLDDAELYLLTVKLDLAVQLAAKTLLMRFQD